MPNPFDIGKSLVNTLTTPKSRVNVDAFNKIPPEPAIANSLNKAPDSVVPGSFKLNDYGGIGNFTRNAQDADIYNQKNKLPGDQNQWANSVPVIKNPRVAYRTGPAFFPPSAIKQIDDAGAGSDLMSDNFNWLPGGTLTKAAPNGAIAVPPDWETKMMRSLSPGIYNHTMGDIIAHESRHGGTLNEDVLNYDKNALGDLKSMSSKTHDYSPMEMRDYISHEQQNLFKNKGSRITNPEDWGKYFDEHTNARPDNGFLKNTWNKLTTPAPSNTPGTIDSERMWDKLRELKGSNPDLFDKIKQWQMKVAPGIVDNNVMDKIGAPIIDNKIFRNRTATNFNRHSPMDQFNADRIKNKLEPFNFKEWQNRNKKPALLGSLPANTFSKQLNPAPIGPPPMVANSIKEPPLNFADTPKPTAPSLDQQFNPDPIEPPKQQAQINPKEFNFAPTPTQANPPEPDFVQQPVNVSFSAAARSSTPQAGPLNTTIKDKLKAIATSPDALNIGAGVLTGAVVGNVSSDKNKTRNTFLGGGVGGAAAALNPHLQNSVIPQPQNSVIPQPQGVIPQPQGVIPQPQGVIPEAIKAPGLIDQAKARLQTDPAVSMVNKYKQGHGGYLAQLAGLGSPPNLTGPETEVQGKVIDALIKYRKPLMQGAQFVNRHSGDVDALGGELLRLGDKYKIPAASKAGASLASPTSPETQAKIDELKSGVVEKVKNEIASAVTSPAVVRAAAPKVVNTAAALAARILPTAAPALKGFGGLLGKAGPIAFAGSLLNEGHTAANYPGGTAAYMQDGRDINELPLTKGNYMAGVLQNWAHPGRTILLAGEGLANPELYKGVWEMAKDKWNEPAPPKVQMNKPTQGTLEG